MTKIIYTNVITAFKGAGASMRCQEAKALLRKLDFELKDGRRGGHKVYTHPHIASFTSGSLNCDHGRNPEIKKPYIKKIIKVLEKYENELVKYLEKRNE
ncbi:hypothetical protein BMR02_15040 [Methylococcaceae bacterium HT1]|nr:hypothetical protein BMR10_17465 [Methylococcaceae bacterium CS4]TXK93311.1 hypothetical protein BMR11_17145 [Methylococcaceae bacterium CS5]TXK93564.1 hypothetical protein BMR02_15040 [Methylococcaceae bacterium HT1]TXL02489.1 hypothetical protein BMR07_17700 [Methylococcaceae bacterium CS1]TXL02545.1 hypothetical protein BMR08_18170 [Methylococcaceae bacterium CS2]TXL02623.1 hypothetical protein BMR09_16505 [Methylococcaceae bacterium CS3]TXL12511.1 hypothetical protein BMR05_15165 [Meth